ncbi:gluconokinase [Azospirillum agricola]|uniref:gluconokinase n=1 Tax=Azospirillum agricola TaxID=1720247 RepID=UPI000A0F2029|nr:gluconokinase [Azospirillum agricola]SMH62622.1 gluconate kinase, SKI family [Azospirillum lipoferum]
MIGPPIVVVMGVAGCGKSSVGQGLADALGCTFIEGDQHHPTANIAKMSSGIPLTDADRVGWLAVLAGFIADADREGRMLVVACSALKRRYRDQLRGDSRRVVFLHLRGDKALIASRMGARTAHFMPTALIDSQFADLEPPDADETALTYDITLTAREIVADARLRLAALYDLKPDESGAAAGEDA